jgi:hypothetical protein
MKCEKNNENSLTNKHGISIVSSLGVGSHFLFSKCM